MHHEFVTCQKILEFLKRDLKKINFFWIFPISLREFFKKLITRKYTWLAFFFFWSRDARTFVTMEIVSSDPTVYISILRCRRNYGSIP